MKMYVDTCIVSGLAKSEFKTDRNDRLFEILTLAQSRKIDLVTSDLMAEELEKIPLKYRTAHQSLYLLLEKIPRVGEVRPSMLAMTGVGGGAQINPIFKALTEILPDLNDAKHVFTALGNGCTHFLTVDERTIIKNRVKLKSVASITVILPEEFTG